MQISISLRNMFFVSLAFFKFDHDISRVRRSNISFHVGFIQVHKSKNNQRRKGNEV